MPHTPSSAPPFFTWVIPDKLSAHGLPNSPDHIQFLWDVGVRHLVSLTKEFKPELSGVPGMNWMGIDIIDWHAPTMEQIEEFLEVVERANAKGEVSERKGVGGGGWG